MNAIAPRAVCARHRAGTRRVNVPGVLVAFAAPPAGCYPEVLTSITPYGM